MRNKNLTYTGILAILMLILVACSSQATLTPTEETEIIEEDRNEPEEEAVEEPAVLNTVTVTDQELGSGNTVTVANVTTDSAGWLVIHAQAGGSPGPIVGFAPVETGENSDVLVNIEAAGATETLYAMLHVDAGTLGEYEFPGEDVPAVNADGNLVTPPFQIDLSRVNAVHVADQILGERNTFTIAAVQAAEAGWIAIHAQVDDSPGPILGLEPVAAGTHENIVVRIDIDDLSDVLYAILYVDGGAPEIFEFPPSDDIPAKDAEGKIIAPIFNRIPSTVEIGYNEELGAFLVGANGLTLYQFTRDEEGESNCADQCAAIWPPLLVEATETPSPGPDVDGELSTIRRTEGTFQVTYDNMPLYFYTGDENFGDANGHTSGGVWFVLKP
jgi:predicted lipoprotein with Yx(FWY)xxD motif